MSAGLASSTRTGRFANESRPSTEDPPAALPVQDKRERFGQILSMHLTRPTIWHAGSRAMSPTHKT
jgi:hypothetical protein